MLLGDGRLGINELYWQSGIWDRYYGIHESLIHEYCISYYIVLFSMGDLGGREREVTSYITIE